MNYWLKLKELNDLINWIISYKNTKDENKNNLIIIYMNKQNDKINNWIIFYNNKKEN